MAFAQGIVAFSTVRLVYGNELVATDFNRDGVSDLLIASAAPPLQLAGTSLLALVGLGDGLFFDNTATLLTSVPAATINPSAIVTADFNRDGISDFFVADAGRLDPSPFPGAQNQLALSTQGGSWFNAATTNLPARADVSLSASAADIDGNGSVDLYVGNVDGFLSVPPTILLNDGTGSFAVDGSRLPEAVVDPAQRYTAATFIDANVNGRSDLFLGGGSGTASTLLENVAGVFGPAPGPSMPGKAFGGSSFDSVAYSLDITGDALPDLLVANTTDGFVGRALQVFVNQGGFEFTDESARRLAGVNELDPGIRRVLFADLNRDGATDLLLEAARGPAQVLLNDGDGHFFAPLGSVLSGIDGPLAVGDFNGDGNPDIVAWSGRPSTTLSFFAGDGAFPYRTTGTDGDDFLSGTNRADVLDGRAGSDVIRGGGGNDHLNGGEGDDELQGGSGDDRLEGDDGSDLLVAAAGNDTILGGAGNDRILGLEGADVVDGGAGMDVWHLQGVLRQYEVAGDAKVNARIAGAAGSASLTAVEAIQWLDGRLTFDPNDHFAQAYRLYFVTLGRAPDPLGNDFWSAHLDAGASLSDVTSALLASPESQRLYSGLGDTQFVQALYANTLQRPAEPEGLSYWVARLAGGMSRAEVAAGFAESPEHVALRAGAVDAGLFDVDEGSASVARIYYGALGRSPEVEGLAYWRALLESHASLVQVSEAIAASDEFSRLYGGLSNDAFVAALYQQVLDRAPGLSETAFWMAQLDAGLSRGAVMLGFTDSIEHQTATVAQIERGIVVADASVV